MSNPVGGGPGDDGEAVLTTAAATTPPGATSPSANAPATTTATPSVSNGTPSAVSDGDLQSVEMDQVVLALEPGQPLARNTGLMCGVFQDVEAQHPGEHAYEDLAKSARQGLAKGGIPVALQDSLFDNGNQAPFLLRGRATEVDFTFCAVWSIEMEGSITVTWELYSLLEQRVVYKVATLGRAKSSGERPEVAAVATINLAVAAAAGLLAKDQDFRKALRADAPVARATGSGGGGAIGLATLPQFSGGFPANAGRVAAATVLLRGLGHGSGFFISADGLLLINAHVVRGLAQVQIELSDGRVLTGDVLRNDNLRDVALIRVPISGAPALPLDRALPRVGAEVYASGAPFDTAYSGTITKGIVSALRRGGDGATWIQADVDVQPGNSGGPLLDGSGNVIGITTFGLQPEGSSIGLNFFVPIDLALAALRLTPR